MHPELIKLPAESHPRDLRRVAERYRLTSSAKVKQGRNTARMKRAALLPDRVRRPVRWALASVESTHIDGAR